MKLHRAIPSLLAAATTVIPAHLANAQGTWRAERTRRGDTAIVRTLSGSVWPDTMVLIPEIAVGAGDGAEPFLFGRVRAIDVDAAGRMYVLDAQAYAVRVFSATGEHIRSIGRRGGGPGEFQNPGELRVLSDGRVFVRDSPARMSLFAADGTYQTGWALNPRFGTGSPFYVTTNERILNPTFSDRLVWYQIDGKALDTIVRSTPSREEKNPNYDAQRSQTGSPTMWVSPTIADVFDAQGRYLGAVKVPKNASFYPRPVVSAQRAWLIATHDDGYHQIVRYRLQAASAK